VKLKGFQKLTLTDKALQIWLKALHIGEPKKALVPLQDAVGRVLVEDLTAVSDLPRFDRSAMDGYAINSSDSSGASQFKPAIFQLTESEEIGSKQAKQVWTGNPIPKCANAVVMLENTKKTGEKLEVWNQLTPNENVSRIGEDIKKGSIISKAGNRLNPYHVGLAAALGMDQIRVAEKPKIAILATGNELAEVGSKLSGNLIYDSNKIMLSALCRELGAESIDYGIAKDKIEEIGCKIQSALENHDAVITTGGTSVGGLDLVPEVVNKLGKPGVVVHGVAARPAMPTALAVLQSKPILILSGNPVAAIIGFEIFGRPLICKLLGMDKTEQRPMLKATLTRRVASALGRRTYVRVRVYSKGDEFIAEPVSAKGSGSISTMAMSNGFVVVPENREGLGEREAVIVQLFSSLEAAT